MGNRVSSMHDKGSEVSKTLAEFAYKELRKDIISGALLPNTRLSAGALKTRFKVSLSTMREALTRLVGDSLVTSEGQRGFRVAPISKRDFADLTEVRKLVETEALRRSIERGDEYWEGEVLASFHRLTKIEEKLGKAIKDKDRDAIEEIETIWEKRNSDFHETLISACDSEWLLRLYKTLYYQADRYRQITFRSQDEYPRDVHDEHRAIMEAALSRDVNAACKFSISHISKTLEFFNRVYPD